ncbi:MAG: hypothetical protein PHV68_05925 [Candidatus Gastranaerophilales bacterium]|nr:hypothetical protein [Candidatus Gastranaerophilales bacterium]
MVNKKIMVLTSVIALAFCLQTSVYADGLTPLPQIDAAGGSVSQLPSVPMVQPNSSELPVGNTYNLNMPMYNSSNMLQQAVEQLTQAQMDVKRQHANVKAQYNQVDIQYKRVKEERRQLKRYLKQINKKIKSLESAKKDIQKNMKIK